MQNMSNHEVDGLQQQKTMLGSTSEQNADATVCTGDD